MASSAKTSKVAFGPRSSSQPCSYLSHLHQLSTVLPPRPAIVRFSLLFRFCLPGTTFYYQPTYGFFAQPDALFYLKFLTHQGRPKSLHDWIVNSSYLPPPVSLLLFFGCLASRVLSKLILHLLPVDIVAGYVETAVHSPQAVLLPFFGCFFYQVPVQLQFSRLVLYCSFRLSIS